MLKKNYFLRKYPNVNRAFSFIYLSLGDLALTSELHFGLWVPPLGWQIFNHGPKTPPAERIELYATLASEYRANWATLPHKAFLLISFLITFEKIECSFLQDLDKHYRVAESPFKLNKSSSRKSRLTIRFYEEI